MDRRQLTGHSFFRGLILFASAVVLAIYTPLATQTRTAASQAVQPTTRKPALPGTQTGPVLPRKETLYFNGLQWLPVNGWNPYSGGMNNQMAIAQQDNARVTVFETPYIYNMLTGEQFPLLADGRIHGTPIEPRSPSRSKLPHIGETVPR